MLTRLKQHFARGFAGVANLTSAKPSTLDVVTINQVARGAGIIVLSFMMMFVTRSGGPSITADDLDGILGFLAGMGALIGYRAVRAGELSRLTAIKLAALYAAAVVLRYLMF